MAEVRACPTSFPLPPTARGTLGIGRAVRRDAVVVRAMTDDGRVGWRHSHHLDGGVRPLEPPGISVDVNGAFLEAHPVVEGPAHV